MYKASSRKGLQSRLEQTANITLIFPLSIRQRHPSLLFLPRRPLGPTVERLALGPTQPPDHSLSIERAGRDIPCMDLPLHMLSCHLGATWIHSRSQFTPMISSYCMRIKDTSWPRHFPGTIDSVIARTSRPNIAFTNVGWRIVQLYGCIMSPQGMCRMEQRISFNAALVS